MENHRASEALILRGLRHQRAEGSIQQQRWSRTCHVRGYTVLDEAGELLLVGVLVLFHQVAHVLGHVDAHDVLAVDLSVELLALSVVSREALGAGRDVSVSDWGVN